MRYLRSSSVLGAICAMFTQLRRSGEYLCAIYAAPALSGRSVRYSRAPALWELSVRYLRSSGALGAVRYLRSSSALEAICALITQLWRSGGDL